MFIIVRSFSISVGIVFCLSFETMTWRTKRRINTTPLLFLEYVNSFTTMYANVND